MGVCICLITLFIDCKFIYLFISVTVLGIYIWLIEMFINCKFHFWSKLICILKNTKMEIHVISESGLDSVLRFVFILITLKYMGWCGG